MQTLIYAIIALCVILSIAIVCVLAYVWRRDQIRKKGPAKEGSSKENKSADDSQLRLQGIESMSKFLDFDDIVDNMIVRKNRSQYVMVLHCKGVNYDLLGEEEKVAIESGFIQFLNTLKFPIQLYVQSRSLNLRESIDQYESKINEVKSQIDKIDEQIRKETMNGRNDLVKKLQFEKRRKENILEYGTDITNYVARLSQNRNVLQQNTYLIISFYSSEIGVQTSNYSKEEIDGMAFSELYTRAQTVIRTLSSAGVVSRVMESEELAELLYIAYNRDDSELMSIKRAIDAGYDSLYNSSKDILEKQKEAIEHRADKEAVDLAASSITNADQELRRKALSSVEIKRRALEYVEQYKGEMTDDLYEETVRQVKKAKIGNEYDSSEEDMMEENDFQEGTSERIRRRENAMGRTRRREETREETTGRVRRREQAEQSESEEARRRKANQGSASEESRRRIEAQKQAREEARRRARMEAVKRTRPEEQSNRVVKRKNV